MKPPTGDSRGQPGTRASGDLARCLRAVAWVAFLCVGTQSPPGWDHFSGVCVSGETIVPRLKSPRRVLFPVTAQRADEALARLSR